MLPPIRWILRLWVVGLVAVGLTAGCGADAKQQPLSVDDLSRIAKVQPTPTSWHWPQKPTREPLKSNSCDGWRWQDEDKLGVTFICLLDSASQAHRELPQLRAYARLWIKRDAGRAPFTDVRVRGVGDEAWRIEGNFSKGQQVTYGWRRDALMLQVHIQCIFQSCPSAILPATRAWVDAIDEEARRRT
jgi:hypothetical protein